MPMAGGHCAGRHGLPSWQAKSRPAPKGAGATEQEAFLRRGSRRIGQVREAAAAHTDGDVDVFMDKTGSRAVELRGRDDDRRAAGCRRRPHRDPRRVTVPG